MSLLISSTLLIGGLNAQSSKTLIVYFSWGGNTRTAANMIKNLTQADMFGSSIIDTMYNQVDYLREKKKLEIKAEISKVPIKISIISVLFFVPLILLIILSPVILSYIG